MKILYTCTYSAGISGVWNRVYNLGLEMMKRGHEVYVFSSNLESGTMKKVEEFEERDGIKCYRFPVRVILSKNALDFSKSKKVMQAKLREIMPDVIDCQTYRHSEGNIISKEAEKIGIKSFLTTHAPFVSVGVRGIALSLITKIYDFWHSERVLKRFKKIITISEWERPYLNKLGVEDKQISYIPNGIPAEFFENEREFGKNVKKVLFFGRVAPVKDVETLLMAWELVEKNNKDIVLEIVGPLESEYRTKLEGIIKNHGLTRVIFKGAVFDIREKIGIYDSAEIFVLPSKREGMPQSLIEAMARGDIVIASSIEACKEIVQDKKNGFIFQTRSEVELANKIISAITDYKNLGKIRANAIKTATSFKWDKLADKLEKLYKS